MASGGDFPGHGAVTVELVFACARALLELVFGVVALTLAAIVIRLLEHVEP